MTSLRTTIVYGFLLALLACGEDPVAEPRDPGDDTGDAGGGDDEETPPTTGSTRDAGRPATSTPKDAGTATSSGPRDSGTSTSVPKDAGVLQGGPDAGKPATGVDAGKDAGGGFMIPDLFPPASDAGTTPTTPGKPGAKDGPCKDLMLFCFDPFDMFIFNPSDCFTCNGGKGCQGCAIPYAF